MKILTAMISPIGACKARLLRKVLAKKGFTFVEVMVTLVIFSVGILAIYKTFLLSLSQMEHLTKRFYATAMLDNEIASIERAYRVYHTFSADINASEENSVSPVNVSFKKKLEISQIEDYGDIFKLDLTLHWRENGNPKTLSRSAYILDSTNPYEDKRSQN